MILQEYSQFSGPNERCSMKKGFKGSSPTPKVVLSPILDLFSSLCISSCSLSKTKLKNKL